MNFQRQHSNNNINNNNTTTNNINNNNTFYLIAPYMALKVALYQVQKQSVNNKH